MSRSGRVPKASVMFLELYRAVKGWLAARFPPTNPVYPTKAVCLDGSSLVCGMVDFSIPLFAAGRNHARLTSPAPCYTIIDKKERRHALPGQEGTPCSPKICI